MDNKELKELEEENLKSRKVIQDKLDKDSPPMKGMFSNCQFFTSDISGWEINDKFLPNSDESTRLKYLEIKLKSKDLKLEYETYSKTNNCYINVTFPIEDNNRLLLKISLPTKDSLYDGRARLIKETQTHKEGSIEFRYKELGDIDISPIVLHEMLEGIHISGKPTDEEYYAEIERKEAEQDEFDDECSSIQESVNRIQDKYPDSHFEFICEL